MEDCWVDEIYDDYYIFDIFFRLDFDLRTFKSQLLFFYSLDIYSIMVLKVMFSLCLNLDSLEIVCIHPTRSKAKERCNMGFLTKLAFLIQF